MSQPFTTLCLTPGDPTGIGPEITAKFLNRPPQNIHFIVVGDQHAVEQSAAHLKIDLPGAPLLTWYPIEKKLPGQVAYESLVEAVKLIQSRQADALVTGPISKKNLMAAGYSATGHTEILDSLAKATHPVSQADMLFVHQGFRLLLLTRHIALSQVPQALRAPQTVKCFENLVRFLKNDVGIHRPRIAVLGVNPHAGEVGGTEECEILMPLMSRFQDADFYGPFPADAFFRGFRADAPGYDAVIAPYHDQGLIPFKLLAGYEAVNVTIGLPFIRTSVGHGTGEDIVGRNVANPASLYAAVTVADKLVRQRQVSLF